MKNSLKFGLLICGLLLLNERSVAQDKPNSSRTSLTLNGQPVDYNTFWLNRTGVLALVEGEPQSAHKSVAFRVSLRRAGTIIRQWPAAHEKGVYSVQLADFWSYAQLGDELVVDPVDGPAFESGENPGRRVIKLRSVNWLAHCLPADNC